MKRIVIFSFMLGLTAMASAQFGLFPSMGGGMPFGMPAMQNSVNKVEIESSNLPIISIDTKGHEIT